MCRMTRAVPCRRNVMAPSTIPGSETPALWLRGRARRGCRSDLALPLLHAAPDGLEDLGRLRAGRRDAALRLHVRHVVQRDELLERGVRIGIRRGSLAASEKLA